jgi:hypothetical protein
MSIAKIKAVHNDGIESNGHPRSGIVYFTRHHLALLHLASKMPVASGNGHFSF